MTAFYVALQESLAVNQENVRQVKTVINRSGEKTGFFDKARPERVLIKLFNINCLRVVLGLLKFTGVIHDEWRMVRKAFIFINVHSLNSFF